MQRLTPHIDLGLLGSGMHLPGHPVPNIDVLRWLRPRMPADRLQHASSALEQVHGLRHRHWIAPPGEPTTQTSADLAIKAGRAALVDAGVTGSDVSALWVCTSTPPSWTSATAAKVGAALGVHGPCVDLRSGCSSGLHALVHASLAIGAGAGPQLIIGAETFTRVLPPTHRPSVVSMGDGAAAVLVGAGSGKLLATAQHTHTALHDLVGTRGVMPPTQQAIEQGGYLLSGDPSALGEAIAAELVRTLHATVPSGQSVNDTIDDVVLHQTHGPMVRAVCEGLHVPLRKGVCTVHQHGNVGSAGWLVCLHIARATERVGPGSRVLVGAAGGGVTSAAALWHL